MWRRQPEIYLDPGLDGIFSLWLHRLKPEPDLVRATIARMRAIPSTMEAARRNLRAELAPRIYLERGIGQARAGARYLSEVVAAEVADETLRGELSDWGGIAAGALEVFADHLTEMLPRATGEYAIGVERYSRLLREKELLADDAPALRGRGQAQYDLLAAELREFAQRIDGTDDWAAVLASFNLDHPPTPEAMLEAYADSTAEARQFLRDRALVSFPDGEECLVEPSPLFQRPVIAVASYNSPPPFSSAMRGHFFVPFPPDGAPEAEIQQRLERTAMRRSRRRPSTRRTPATTGTWSWPKPTRVRSAAPSARPTSPRAGASTPSR